MSQPTDDDRKTVRQWRQEIDILDSELLRLLNERARIAKELGALKYSSGQPVYDSRRERQILARLCESNQGPLDAAGVMSIFRAIIRESRRVERNSQQHPQDQVKEAKEAKSEFGQDGQEYSHGH